MIRPTDAPFAPAVLRPPVADGEVWTWLVRFCPYCTRPHVHSAGPDGTLAGPRRAWCGRGVYRITELEIPRPRAMSASRRTLVK